MTLHIGTVARTGRLSAGMVRVTVGGLDRFVTTGVGDEYVRVHFPEPDGSLRPPVPNDEGGWDYPEGAVSHVAPYTIRAHRPESAEVDLDFVLHGHGYAGRWAAAATAGEAVAFGDPRGLFEPPHGAGRHVFVTDETGLPALARLLEQLPAESEALAIVETAAPGRRIPIERPAGALELRWIEGRGNGVAPSAMTEALRGLELGEQDYVWVAGESGELREARRHLRRERGLPAERCTVIGYWTHRP